MGSYRALEPTDWVLLLFVTAVVVGWQLSVNGSFSSRTAGALLFGGVALGAGVHLLAWYRER